MPMYNLIEYNKNYRKTTDSLWNYYREEPADPITDSESFKYKIIITGSMPEDDDKKRVSITIPLKQFWRTLNIALLNCKVNLVLTWSKNCVLTDMTLCGASAQGDPPVINSTIGASFSITDAKLHIPVITLSTE